MPVTSMLAASQQGPTTTADVRALIDQVKAKTDLREFLRPKLGGHREFEGYWQTNCLAPDHQDTAASLLVYPDQCRCQACQFKADILDFYRMEHPDEKLTDAITKLLTDPSIKFTGEVKSRVIRGLDQDLAVRYHLALVDHPEAVAGLEGMGFLREAIREFQLGYTEVLVRLEAKERPLAEAAPRIEWLEINDERIPFQRQMRYSVPVFNSGRLVQMLYRKAETDDLGPKITMEKGAGVHLFNADALKDAEMAAYVEGWGDVIILWQAGITAVTSTSGAGHFNEDWTDLLGHVKRLYIGGDADDAGQRLVARFKKRLPWARQLPEVGAHGSKDDYRDLWLKGWRQREFAQLLRKADMQASWTALKRTR